MRARVLLSFLLLSAALAAAQRDVIDGIVVLVSGRPILRTEWDDAARFERLANGRPPDGPTAAEHAAALERLIDQALMSQQMERAVFPRASKEDVEQRVREIRALHSSAVTDESWRALLATYVLSESDVVDRVTQQFDLLRFLDLRFRPLVFITQSEIERYYRETFLPEVRKAGGADLPLRQVSPQIREVLTQRRIDEMTGTWLESLRAQASIVRRAPKLEKAASP